MITDTISWDICKDFADFSGEDEQQVRMKAAQGAQLAAEAWNSLPGKTFFGKASRFYQEMSGTYIYDHLLAHLNHQFIRDWYERHLSPICGGKKVLDFGAGIGIFAIQMAMDGAHVIYYDLEGIPRDFAMWRVQHVNKHLGPFNGSLHFVDNPFLLGELYDIIFSYATLEHIHDAALRRSLEAMDSSLNPGGLMIHFIDPNVGESHPMHRPNIVKKVRSFLQAKGYNMKAEPAVPAPGVWVKMS